MSKEIRKRFPATINLQETTFLNDKKANGELYAYLQSISFPKDNQTIIDKKNMPLKKTICDKIGIKQVRTLNVHLNYLIEQGYIIDKITYYILPNVEDVYSLIPLETIQFLNDTVQEHVFKIYIYLAQRYSYKKNYEFTIAELAANIGLKLNNHSRPYKQINNVLEILRLCGLIDFKEVKTSNVETKKILTDFSFYVRKEKCKNSQFERCKKSQTGEVKKASRKVQKELVY